MRFTTLTLDFTIIVSMVLWHGFRFEVNSEVEIDNMKSHGITE